MYRKIGAFYKGNGQCEFTVWAPFVDCVEIELPKDNRIVPLLKEELGYWSGEVNNVQPESLYWCILNKKKKIPDICSMSQPEGVFGSSQVIDQCNFEWTDNAWHGIPLKDMIIYEIHVGTFTSEGTFEGIISKIDHLLKLGVNTIELMPVAQFSGERNWGYDGVFPFAVQHSYGGVNGLKKLIDACHKAKIAVVMDVVYNHLGPEGNFFHEYGPYFTDKYNTPWGSAINFDDAYSDEVRNLFLQNIRMWLCDYHIDALRLDAVHAYKDNSALHFVKEISNFVKALSKDTGKNYVLIGECDLNDPKYIASAENEGFGLDGQWIDEFHHSIHSILTNEKDGYYEDFGKLEHVYRAYKDTFVYAKRYSFHRKRTFGAYPIHNHYDQFVVFIQNHDQIGNRLRGDRLSSLVSFEALKLAAAAVLTSPYVPLLFMGEETAAETPFYFFSDYSGKELIEKMTFSRKEEFKSFQWEGDFVDSQLIETFQQSKLNWDFSADNKRLHLFSFYKELIQLRKKHSTFQNRTRGSLNILINNEQTLLIVERRSEDFSSYISIIMNFSKKSAESIWPEEEKGRLLLDSTSLSWLGPGSNAPNEIYKGKIIPIAAESIVIYEYKKNPKS
jgi:maltooligosyltrehalose trehalohydrolase